MSPAPLSSTPAQVADAVVAALGSGRDVVWVPGALRPEPPAAQLTLLRDPKWSDPYFWAGFSLAGDWRY